MTCINYEVPHYTLPFSLILPPPSTAQSLCQHPVLEHPQLAFLSQCKRSTLVVEQLTGKVTVLNILIFKGSEKKKNDLNEFNLPLISPCTWYVNVVSKYLNFTTFSKDLLLSLCCDFGLHCGVITTNKIGYRKENVEKPRCFSFLYYTFSKCK